MNKKIFIITILLLAFSSANFVFGEKSPLDGWYYETGVRLNGRWFEMYDSRGVAESFREQEGWAMVNGEKVRYWLYDTFTYHDGDSHLIYDRYVPYWVEQKGYVIDFDNIQVINPNKDLPSSVKALMKQRGCDVGIVLVEGDETKYVVINEYMKGSDTYKTTIYYLY